MDAEDVEGRRGVDWSGEDEEVEQGKESEDGDNSLRCGTVNGSS